MNEWQQGITLGGVLHARKTDADSAVDQTWVSRDIDAQTRNWTVIGFVPGAVPQRVHDVDVLQVRVQRGTEDLRSRFQQVLTPMLNWLNNVPPQPHRLTIPTQGPKPRVITGDYPEAQAFLLQSRARELTLASVRALFTNAAHAEQLGAVWLAQTDYPNLEPARSVALPETADPLLLRLQPYGEVVYDRCPPNPSRTCVLLKHCHADPKTVGELTHYPKYGPLFVQHQNAAADALTDLDASSGGLEFFMEQITTGSERRDLRIVNRLGWLAHTEANAVHLASDRDAAKNFFTGVQRAREGLFGEQSANWLLNRYGAGVRFLKRTLAHRPNWRGQLHGLYTSQRVASEPGMFAFADAEDDPPESVMIDLTRKDYQNVHGHLTTQLEGVPAGRTSAVLLGGGHFASGAQHWEFDRYPELKRVTLEESVERYLERSQGLADTRIVVLEPRHYAKLLKAI